MRLLNSTSRGALLLGSLGCELLLGGLSSKSLRAVHKPSAEVSSGVVKLQAQDIS
jgi:hypothetical protein